MQNTFTLPSVDQMTAKFRELQTRLGLSDEGFANALDWAIGREDLDFEGEEKLMEYYLHNGMPYREAKAIDADPYVWIRNKLKEELSFFC